MAETDDKRVVGLRYEPGAGMAPSVILKGQGKLAEAMLQRRSALAKPPALVQDRKLVEQLYRLPMDAEIGPDLYEVVAILLVHVFSVAQKLQERDG
jgi:flagellar biosynthesis protein